MNTTSIHTILARSYLIYFIGSIVGLYIDTRIGWELHIPFGNQLALVCFAIGSLLIMWAQYTSRHHGKAGGVPQTPYFLRGPYRYLRNPTQLGIVLLVLGYTLTSGSVVFCLVTVVGYFVSNIFFRHYEKILALTYDGEYKTYKTKVPKIL